MFFFKSSPTLQCVIKSILIKAQFQLIALSHKLHNSILLSTMLNGFLLNFELNINLQRFSEAFQSVFLCTTTSYYNTLGNVIACYRMTETKTLVKKDLL